MTTIEIIGTSTAAQTLLSLARLLAKDDKCIRIAKNVETSDDELLLETKLAIKQADEIAEGKRKGIPINEIF
ncbi:MAG: hypothetical protein IKO34_09940 [Bacteroidales bacterium]|nr:hypothetical protein [Bacteroidales bacterium]